MGKAAESARAQTGLMDQMTGVPTSCARRITCSPVAKLKFSMGEKIPERTHTVTPRQKAAGVPDSSEAAAASRFAPAQAHRIIPSTIDPRARNSNRAPGEFNFSGVKTTRGNSVPRVAVRLSTIAKASDIPTITVIFFLWN